VKKNLVFIFLFSVFSGSAASGLLCNSKLTRELEACAKKITNHQIGC
jgi:hypothetical protein